MENIDQVIINPPQQDSLQQEGHKQSFSRKRIIFLILGIFGGIIVCYLLLVGILILSNDLMTNSSNCERNVLGIPKRCASQTSTQFPIPTQNLNPMANWQTYTNDNLGISFQYPPDWTLQELMRGDSTITFVIELQPNDEKMKKIHHSISLRYYENPKSLSISELDKELKKTANIDNCSLYNDSSTDQLIKGPNNIDVYYREKGICEPLNAMFYTFQHEKKVFQLIDSYWLDQSNPQDKILSQILSTFKFLDQTQILNKSNWKTYKNPTWQYEISYPPDWIVLGSEDDNTTIYNKNQYVSILVTKRTKANLEEEAQKEGEVHPQCAMGSPCTPDPAKKVEKKEDSRFKELYEVTNIYGRKFFVFSFPTTDDYYITINPFPISKFFEEIPEDLFTQIFSTFKFINKAIMTTKPVKLFYYNTQLDPQNVCSTDAVVAVGRNIPKTMSPIKDTIELLIKGGLNPSEKVQGFSTEFPHPDFKLTSINLKNEILTLHFSVVPGFTSGGACRVGLLRSQIEKTAKQFPEVKEVIFEPEDLFQP